MPASTPMIASTKTSSSNVTPRRMGPRWGRGRHRVIITSQFGVFECSCLLPVAGCPVPSPQSPVPSTYIYYLTPHWSRPWADSADCPGRGRSGSWVRTTRSFPQEPGHQRLEADRRPVEARWHDLIPNLVNTVKGAMDFERSTLEAVIAARNKAVSAQGVPATAKAEGELTQALGRPSPSPRPTPSSRAPERAAAPGGAHQHREQDRVRAAALQRRCDAVQHQADAVSDQPGSRTGQGVARRPLEIEDAAERAVPKVDLSLNKPTA